MADIHAHMTWPEIVNFHEANLDGMEAFHVACLIKRHGQWILCVGETQSDGVFRHVDVSLEPERFVDPMLNCLRGGSPEGQAAQAVMVERIRTEASTH